MLGTGSLERGDIQSSHQEFLTQCDLPLIAFSANRMIWLFKASQIHSKCNLKLHFNFANIALLFMTIIFSLFYINEQNGWWWQFQFISLNSKTQQQKYYIICNLQFSNYKSVHMIRCTTYIFIDCKIRIIFNSVQISHFDE